MPATMNVQMLAVAKNFPNSMKSTSWRQATKSGEYKQIAKRTCKVVKHPTDSTSTALSSRSALFSSDFTAAVTALEACSERPLPVGYFSCSVAVTE